MKIQEFNFITGYAKNRIRDQNWNGTLSVGSQNIQIDYSKPVTLERCKKILERCEKETGREYSRIELNHAIYSKTDGNELGDYPEQTFLDKKYVYDAIENSLLIYDRGEPVYANDNGAICNDHAALCDSLFD